MQRRTTLSISAGVMLVLVAAIWIIFAPVQIGGSSSFVIVDGNSMEPYLHKGDLVFVRTAESYAVGDVVTYRHPEIGPVIHRIIQRDGNQYVFQGDNNDFVDGFHPTDRELIGREWFHIPRVGGYLTWVREPRNLAILVVVIGVIVMSSFARNELDKDREKDADPRRTPALSGAAAPPDPPRAELLEALKILVVVMIGAGLVAGIAFTRPLRTNHSETLNYDQNGAFAYTALADAGGVYDGDAAVSGEPVFRNVSQTVNLTFEYTLTSRLPSDLSGNAQLIAEVSDTNGWKRTVILAPSTPFAGNTTQTSATLDLDTIQALIDGAEAETDFARPQYTVSIIPQVHISGTLDGQPLEDAFAPALAFVLDDFQLRMATPNESEEVLEPTAKGALVRTTRVGNTMSVFAVKLDVGLTRTIALTVIGAAAAGALLLGLWLLRGNRRSRRVAPPAVETAAVEVRAWADLLTLSQRYGVPVQSDVRGRYRRHFVQAEQLTWQFLEIEPHRERTC